MTYDVCMMLYIFISLGLICDNLVIVYLKWCALRAFLLLTVLACQQSSLSLQGVVLVRRLLIVKLKLKES